MFAVPGRFGRGIRLVKVKFGVYDRGRILLRQRPDSTTIFLFPGLACNSRLSRGIPPDRVPGGKNKCSNAQDIEPLFPVGCPVLIGKEEVAKEQSQAHEEPEDEHVEIVYLPVHDDFREQGYKTVVIGTPGRLSIGRILRESEEGRVTR